MRTGRIIYYHQAISAGGLQKLTRLLEQNRPAKSRAGRERVTRIFPDQLAISANGALGIFVLFRFLSDFKKFSGISV